VTGLSIVPAILAREGFQKSLETPEEIFHGKCIIGSGTICMNRTSILMLLVSVVLSALLVAATTRTQLVPSGLQNAVESVYEYLRRDIVIGVMGSEGERWGPYLISLFFFVFFASLVEVIPGLQFPVTSRMGLPFLFAIASWGIYNYAGVKAKGLRGYLKGILFPPGVPKALYVIVTPIEFAAAEVLRPLTLMIRLFANFFAGHLLLVVAFVGTAYLQGNIVTWAFSLVSIVGGVAGIGLEIFIAAVQAYVFSILTAVYISLAVSHEH